MAVYWGQIRDDLMEEKKLFIVLYIQKDILKLSISQWKYFSFKCDERELNIYTQL
jgi:hypothetical protein